MKKEIMIIILGIIGIVLLFILVNTDNLIASNADKVAVILLFMMVCAVISVIYKFLKPTIKSKSAMVELEKYQKLLEANVITQDEYDSKLEELKPKLVK